MHMMSKHQISLRFWISSGPRWLYISTEKIAYGASRASGRPAGAARTFTAVLQLFCPAALLPGLLRCLCRLLLPLSTFTAFVDFCCLWRLPLPLSTFAAFVDFYCLCRLLLPLSICIAFVDFFCLCRLFLPLSMFTAFCRLDDFDYLADFDDFEEINDFDNFTVQVDHADFDD